MLNDSSILWLDENQNVINTKINLKMNKGEVFESYYWFIDINMNIAKGLAAHEAPEETNP